MKIKKEKVKLLDERKVKECRKQFQEIKEEVSKIIVGQNEVVDGLIRGLVADGHVLIEGVPGIAKTLLVRAIAKVVGCKFSRIQFTVDLLPTDITGITVYNKSRGFSILKGPVFANFVMADEINRGTPKVQSALLEAMQEKQVTIGRNTYRLDLPFFVMATQNPIEQAGVYNLPEAQIDRFLFKLKMYYPKMEEEKSILKQNITLNKFDDYKLKTILDPSKILKLQELVKEIYLDPRIEDYIVTLVDATRNPSKYNIQTGKYISYGGSPRASIALFIGSKTTALLSGSSYVDPQHVKDVAYDVLRHRILINYEGQAENIESEKVIDEIFSKIPAP